LVQITKKYANGIGEYLPLEISDRLIPFPRWFVQKESDWNALMVQSNVHILYTFILLAVTWAACFWINQKRDL